MSHTHEPAKNPARAAVVTGATSGIGRATALELARRGWRVYAVGRRAERLETLAADARAEGVSGDVVPAALDVTDEAAVAALASRVEADGGADTLVNIAGGALGTDAVGVGDRADWEWMYRVNVLGTLTMCQAFLPMLRAHGEGTVLNLPRPPPSPPTRAAPATTPRRWASTGSPARCAWRRPSTTCG